MEQLDITVSNDEITRFLDNPEEIVSSEILQKSLFNRLKPEKRKHQERVAKLAKKIAEKYSGLEENEQKRKSLINDAMIAGYLHDIGKSINEESMIKYCSNNKIQFYDFEFFDYKAALHGRISADIFDIIFSDCEINVEYQERLQSIRNAIINHVALEVVSIEGKDKLTLLDKILFIADNCEHEKIDADLITTVLDCDEIKIDTLNQCINSIVSRKKERANQKEMAYNPFYDGIQL